MSQEKNNGDELHEKLKNLQDLGTDDEEEIVLDDTTIKEPEDTPEEPLPEATEESEPSTPVEPEEKKEEKEEEKPKKSRFRRKKSHLKEVKEPMAIRAQKAMEKGKAAVRSGMGTAAAVGTEMQRMGDGMLGASKTARNETARGTQKPVTSTHLREVDPKELKK